MYFLEKVKSLQLFLAKIINLLENYFPSKNIDTQFVQLKL